MSKLTVLSYGAGQDSTALLLMYAHDGRFRAQYAPGDFIVVHSDTGNEHPETYRHVAWTKTFCQEHEIIFVHLKQDMGYHLDKWPDLISFYRRTGSCGSKAFKKVCTDKLKLVPIYKWLSDYVASTYHMPVSGHPYKGKTPLVEFAKYYGEITMIIGIAGDETSRQASADTGPTWQRLSVHRVYPLADKGWTRSDCQDFIRGLGYDVPMPSNCMLCPFMSEQELLWLHHFYPHMYETWVDIERVKLERNQHMGVKNLGVWGKLTLSQVLDRAQKRYAYMTPEMLQDYKMSHGHCLKSKY